MNHRREKITKILTKQPSLLLDGGREKTLANFEVGHLDQRSKTGATTLSIMTFRITINKTQHSAYWQSIVMLSVSYAECRLCWVLLMLSVAYAECRLCWVPLMLSVAYAECRLCWVLLMLSVAYAECHLCWRSHESLLCLVSSCWMSLCWM